MIGYSSLLISLNMLRHRLSVTGKASCECRKDDKRSCATCSVSVSPCSRAMSSRISAVSKKLGLTCRGDYRSYQLAGDINSSEADERVFGFVAPLVATGTCSLLRNVIPWFARDTHQLHVLARNSGNLSTDLAERMIAPFFLYHDIICRCSSVSYFSCYTLSLPIRFHFFSSHRTTLILAYIYKFQFYLCKYFFHISSTSLIEKPWLSVAS